MKFALITTNLRGGGAEKAMLKLAALLIERGHETHFVLLEHLIEHEVPADVRLTALTGLGAPVGKGFVGKYLLAWRLKRLVWRLTIEQPFDLILSTLPFADEVCKLANLPRCWHRIANTFSAEIDRLAQRHPGKAARRRNKYRRIYAGGRLIAVSDGVAGDLLQLGIAAERIERIYNPFDVQAILAKAKDPAALPETSYIVHVGRFSPQKRHDLLLDAFRTLPVTHRLVLLCQTDTALRALIAERSLENRVTIAGFQPNPYPWIAGADLLVLCSDHEGMPNVLIEALLLDTPVVSTDCPSGPREVLQRGRYGKLVPCNDALALARAMHEALAEPLGKPSFDPSPFLPKAAAEKLEQLAKETD